MRKKRKTAKTASVFIRLHPTERREIERVLRPSETLAGFCRDAALLEARERQRERESA